MISQAKSEKQLSEVLKSNKFVVVDAFATWCGPCKTLAPILDAFSQQFSNVKFVKVDVDEMTEFRDEYDIDRMPTLLFFKNGNCFKNLTVVGINQTDILTSIRNLLNQ